MTRRDTWLVTCLAGLHEGQELCSLVVQLLHTQLQLAVFGSQGVQSSCSSREAETAQGQCIM